MRTKVGIPLAHHFLTEPLRAGHVPVALDIAEVSHLLAQRSERRGIPWALEGRNAGVKKPTRQTFVCCPRYQRPRHRRSETGDERARRFIIR